MSTDLPDWFDGVVAESEAELTKDLPPGLRAEFDRTPLIHAAPLTREQALTDIAQ